MIIVEGPDGSGKTTTIQRLGYQRRQLKALRQGLGSEGANPKGWGGDEPAMLAYTRKVMEARFEERSAQAVWTKAAPIAFDRFHLSEVAYAPILRPDRVEIHDGELEMLTRLLRHHKVPVILCLPPFSVTLNNVTKEGRERPSYQTEGFLHQAYKAFELLAPYATIVYDFTRDELPRL
jgi:thymidylate kinase